MCDSDRRIARLLRWARVWLAAMCCTVLVAQVEAASVDVVVVLSSRAAPFRSAATELERCLRLAGRSSRRVIDPSPEQIAEIRRSGARCVAAIGSSATSMLAAEPTSPPLVYCMVADSTRVGVCERAGTFGVTSAVPLPTQFDCLTRAVPTCRRIGMLYRSKKSHGIDPEVVRAALPDGVELAAVDIDQHASVAEAIDELLLRRGVDVVWTAPDPSVFDAPTIKALLLRSVRVRLPVFGYSESFVRAGALLGVAVEPERQGAQAAAIVERVLAPTPSDLAEVHAPEAPQHSLIVNQRVARHLGVELSADLLEQAAILVEER